MTSRLFDIAGGDYLEMDFLRNISAVPLSIAAWFKPDNNTNAQCIAGVFNPLSTSEWFTLAARGDVTGDPIEAAERSGGGWAGARTTTSYVLNKWQHALGVWPVHTGGADNIAYLDSKGRAVSTYSDGAKTITRLAIGSLRDSSPAQPFGGHIDHVGFWSIDLNQADARKLRAGWRCDWVQRPYLEHYFVFDPIEGDIVDQITGRKLTNVGVLVHGEPPPVYQKFPSSIRIVGVPSAVASPSHPYTPSLNVAPHLHIGI